MDIIPFASTTHICSCGSRVTALETGGRCYMLDAPVHGLTERFDPSPGLAPLISADEMRWLRSAMGEMRMRDQA